MTGQTFHLHEDLALDEVDRSLVDMLREFLPADPSWQQLADVGVLGLLVGEEHGGSGAPERVAALTAREVGAAGLDLPVVATGLLPGLWLSALAHVPQAAQLLAGVVDGTVIATPVWQSWADVPGLNIDSLPLQVRFEGEQLLVSGEAHWVQELPGRRSDIYLVAARLDSEAVLLAVRPGALGETAREQPMADGTSWSVLGFDGAQAVSVDAVLARGEAATRALTGGVETATLLVAAELVGLGGRMLVLTLDYLHARQQFGRPIGSFQVLQHRAVDMWIQVRLASAALVDALTVRAALPDDPRERAAAVSSVKYRASAAALAIGNDAVQLHGAIGFTAEYPLGHYVNRALVLGAWLGNARQHAARYADLTRASHDEGGVQL